MPVAKQSTDARADSDESQDRPMIAVLGYYAKAPKKKGSGGDGSTQDKIKSSQGTTQYKYFRFAEDNKSFRGALRINPWVMLGSTDEVIHIRVKQKYNSKDYDFHALIGPESGENARAWVGLSPPRVVIEQGWVFFDGDRPFAEVDMVSAGADGTSMLIRRTKNTDGSYSRIVYYLDKTSSNPVEIEDRKPGSPKESADLADAGWLIEHPDSDRKFKPKEPIPAIDSNLFLTDLRAAACAAGIWKLGNCP